MSITPRKRKRTDNTIDKAIEVSQDKEITTFTTYLPIADADAIKLYALKNRTSTSSVVAKLINDFLKGIN